jgi:Tfp pilus assembly protein PilF/peroxiredoxin
MADAPPDVRALYRRHARGNSLFRNRGDGKFEEKTLDTRVEMGRWAWSSDVLDFDSDGWEDIYVVNGMLTRSGLGEAPAARARASGGGAPRALKEDARSSLLELKDGNDLEGFFWRQVVARSPLTRIKDTPYDDAWRAINQLLIHGSIASRQRNVFLRNDGQGGFDDVSGSVGLDLDQDGRSFSVLDIDRDGDPDLVVMAARQAPQLRVFRNDFAPRGASLAIKLVGAASNRDAIGARVTIETDRLRRTRVVQAGSGFLSQHSKELLFGLGQSNRVVKLTVEWPSGASQAFTEVSLNGRLRLVEGGTLETEKFAPAPALDDSPARAQAVAPPSATWFYEPFPAPEFSLPDVAGETRSVAALRGRPAVLLFWSSSDPGARTALEALSRGREALTEAGVAALAVALDAPADLPRVRTAAPTSVPTVLASPEMALSYVLLNRHLYMNRQDLRLPAALLLDAAGRVVRSYRNTVDVSLILRDAAGIEASAPERLARAVPFAGTFYSQPGRRNYLPYGRELLDQGLEAAAVVAFDRAAQANPSGATLYRLGTLLAKTGETERAQASFERALALQPDLAEANNDLGALLAQAGDLQAAIERFRAALASTPEYPDALNNLGYALLLTGHDAEARALYEKALALQPDFPEALNNLGLLLGRAGEMDRAERLFHDALARRDDYGEAANNLALVLVARGQTKEAIGLLESFLVKAPQYESAYVTLAKIHFNADRPREGIAVLGRLLQRNPKHPVALELLKQYKF